MNSNMEMKILRLSVKNYKSLECVDIKFNGEYCAISGRNNSGKSNIIRLLTNLLSPRSEFPWSNDGRFDFQSDCTQWVDHDNSTIEIYYEFELDGTNDKGFIDFVKKFVQEKTKVSEGKILFKIDIKITAHTPIEFDVYLDNKKVSSKNIIQRLRSSDFLVVHNSTKIFTPQFFFAGKAFVGLDYTKEEMNDIDSALKPVRTKIDKISRKRKEKFEGFLGQLRESYTVDFPFQNAIFSNRDMPFDILLKSCNVKVPLNDWGSGTQNRTSILLSLMKAITKNDTDAVPIMVIEEPESFLHPSAQAEFGNILRTMAKQHKIQIIVTTHSPHMLNIESPECNILLSKPYEKVGRNDHPKTSVVDISKENWMTPFAEHLGLSNDTFKNWASFIGTTKRKILLVEGLTDVKYLKHIQNNKFECGSIPQHIDIVSYNGVAALKNSSLLQFVLSKFDASFILFDLDAKQEVIPTLSGLKLKEKKDYASVGIDSPGKRSMEGLLPDSLIKKVDSDNYDVVVASRSDKKEEAKQARLKLKILYCEEFCNITQFKVGDLKSFTLLISQINKALK